MRTILALLLLSIIHVSTSLSYGQSAFQIALLDEQQNPSTLETYRGEKLTVVDFWATWCKPCLKSMPSLAKLHEKFEAQGVAFVGVSIDSPRNISKVVPRARALKVRYPIALDPNSEAMNRMNAVVVPTLIILDKNGAEVYRHSGFQKGDETDIEKAIVQLLGDEN
jgi:thiol-disulfide isomerase/thioredoxin